MQVYFARKAVWFLLLLSVTTQQVAASVIDFADDFDNGTGGTTAKTGNDGSDDWTTNWTGNVGNGVSYTSSCFSSSYCLQLESSTSSSAVSKRKADLSGASVVSAILTFDYEVVDSVDASGNSKGLVHIMGGGNTNLKVATLLSADGTVYGESIVVPANFLVSDFAVRFKSVNGAVTYIDNVRVEVQETTSTPIEETVADDFSEGGFNGNDGTISWSGPWTQMVGVWSTTMSGWCASGYCLRLITDFESIVTSERAVDLSAFSSATLSFDYRANYNTGGNAEARVVSNGNTYTLGSIPGGSVAGSAQLTIPVAYLTADFRLQFQVTGSGWNDVYIDNILLSVQESGGGGGPPGPTAAPVQSPPDPTAAPVYPPVQPPATATSSTYADDFDNPNGSNSYLSGSDGTLAWNGDWSDGSGIWMSGWWCTTGDCLRLLTSDWGPAAHIDRGANLAGANTARLTFDYQTTLDGIASVLISNSNGATYSYLGGIPDGTGQKDLTIPSSFFTSNFRLQFSVASAFWSDVYIDNVVIELNGVISTPAPVSPTGQTPTPPTPTGSTPTGGGGGSSDGCGNTGFTSGHRYEYLYSSFTNRQYYISIPASYDPNRSYPIIYGLHGRDYNGKDMRTYLRLETTSEADDYIFVYPNGLDSDWPCYGWTSIKGWQTGQRTDNIDHILFDDILEEVSNEYCIDLSRVYVTGQSWGGDMTSSLACARGNKIAAAVSVAATDAHYFSGWSGNSNFPTIVANDCQRAVPMITMGGLTDYYYDAYDPANWWYEINQCTSPAAGYSDKSLITWVGEFEDSGCLEPTIYVVYSNSHTTDHNIPLDYEVTTLDFFAQHSL